jgi:hypothetical protein
MRQFSTIDVSQAYSCFTWDILAYHHQKVQAYLDLNNNQEFQADLIKSAFIL